MAKQKDTRSLDLCAVGLGQGGGNLAAEWRRRGYRSVIFNTAQSDLSAVGHHDGLDMPESDRVHIGIGETDGAGRDPEYGAKCVEAHADIIRRTIERNLDGADALLVCAGLGGGTGSSVYALLDVIEPLDLPVVSVVTLPSHAESGITKVNAVRTANSLVTAQLHGRLFIDNARLIDAFPDVDVVSYYPQVNAAVLSPLDMLNRLNRRDDVWSIRSFDAEDLRKVLLSGGVLQTHIEDFDDGLTSPEQLAAAAARCVDGGNHLASGLDLAQCAYLALVVTGPEAKLRKTSIKVFDEGAELLKARTGGGAVYEGLYVDKDEAAPVRAHILSASLALPQRVESLLADARTEGHDLMRKIQEDIPELEISPLEGLDLFRSPGRRQSSRPRPDAPKPRALGAQMDALNIPSSVRKPIESRPPAEPARPPAQPARPSSPPPKKAAPPKKAQPRQEAPLQKDAQSDIGPTRMDLSEAPAQQRTAPESGAPAPRAEKKAAQAPAARPKTGSRAAKPQTKPAAKEEAKAPVRQPSRATREKDLRRPPSMESPAGTRATPHEPTGVYRDERGAASSASKSSAEKRATKDSGADLDEIQPTEHLDAGGGDLGAIEPTVAVEQTEMVNGEDAAGRRQVPLMTQDGLSEVDSLNLPRDVSIPDGAPLSESFEPSLADLQDLKAQDLSEDLGGQGPTEHLQPGERERAFAEAKKNAEREHAPTDRHDFAAEPSSSIRVGTGRLDSDPYVEEPEVTESVPREQLRANAIVSESSDDSPPLDSKLPSEFDLEEAAAQFELPSSLTRPVDDDAIVAVESFDDDEDTAQGAPPDSFKANPTIISSVNIDDLLLSSIQQQLNTADNHRGRGTALQNVYEDLIDRFKQAPDRRGRERVGRRLIDDAISDDVEVRALAVWAMSKLEQRGFKRALSKSANDRNPEIAKIASAGLEAIEVKQAQKKRRSQKRSKRAAAKTPSDDS